MQKKFDFNTMRKEKMRVTPLFSSKQKFLIYTNGKCGGTSVHEWFFRASGLADATWGDPCLHGFNPIYQIVFPALKKFFPLHVGSVKNTRIHVRFFRSLNRSRSQNLVKSKNDFIHILVVRHPFERLKSGYLDKFCGSDVSRRFVQELRNYTCRQPLETSFIEFLKGLCLMKASGRPLNGHWSPQIESYNANVNTVWIVNVEDLDNSLSKVFESSGLDYQPVRKLNSLLIRDGENYIKDKASFSEVLRKPASEILYTPDLMAAFQQLKDGDFHDKELAKLFKELFFEDYMLGDYDWKLD